MSTNTKLKELVENANRLKIAFTKAYAENDDDRGMEIEKHYLEERLKIIELVNLDIRKRKSISFDEIEKEVAAMPKPIPRETGIRSLDYELVNETDRRYQRIGGFPLGKFVQIAGTRGVGKTSLLLKMISGFTHGEKVSWFDFEIGKVSSVEKLKAFNYINTNLLYYNGSRELEDVLSEIKLLYAEGIRHFVIDSNMKIRVQSSYSEVNRNSIISDSFSELTSSLNINIYLINQVSQASDKDGSLHLKNGNDGEYDADIILFIMKQRMLDERRKVMVDDNQQPLWDDNTRVIKCVKNRPYERLFSVVIPKDEIFTNPVEIVYEENIA